MTRRKGELKKWQIDEGWPYHVALRADITIGKAYDAAREFCENLSLAPMGHSFFVEGVWFNVWCFAEVEDAQKFQARYGGEFMEPEDRPRRGGKVKRQSKQRRGISQYR